MTLPASVRTHLRGLRHVGVVTDDLGSFLARMQAVFGVTAAEIVRVPPPGTPAWETAETRFAFLPLGGQMLEVIEPVSARFKALLEQTNRGANHLCYTVADLPGAIAAMAAAGVRLGHVTADGIAEMPHARMAYFEPDDTAGLLIEFVEPRSP